MRLFFYGTLLDSDVQSAVLGRTLAQCDLLPAVLRHFRRVYIAGRRYPMVVPRRGGMVEGAVVERLNRDDLARIAIYEGDDYRRERHLVFASDHEGPTIRLAATPLAVWLYRSRPSARPSIREWRLASWQDSEKASYLREIDAVRRAPWRGRGAVLDGS